MIDDSLANSHNQIDLLKNTQLDLLKIYAEVISRMADNLFSQNVEKNDFFAFRDACTQGQALSKIALAEILLQRNLHFKKALFIGHWHGLLPLMLKKMSLIGEAKGIELSKYWSHFSENINRDWNWSSEQRDATQLPSSYFDSEAFDLIVNTSCEHMSFDWLKNIPSGTIIMAQANNYEIPEHTNKQNSLQEFVCHLNLSQIYFSGEQDFSVYKRFTVFGKR